MDLIVKYDHTDKVHRYVSSLEGPYTEETDEGQHNNRRLLIPTGTKIIHEIHFKDVTAEESDAIKAHYEPIPKDMGVEVKEVENPEPTEQFKVGSGETILAKTPHAVGEIHNGFTDQNHE